MAQCHNCGHRPRPKGGSRKVCKPCDQLLKQSAAERKNREKAKPASPNNLSQYVSLFHWRGHLVGYKETKYRQQGNRIRILQRGGFVWVDQVADVNQLPERVYNLDEWQEDLDGPFVKAVRNACKALQRPMPGQPINIVVVGTPIMVDFDD